MGKLTPNFGGGRPPKLGEEQQQRLLELLREGQPWKKQEIQHLINEEFDVEFHPAHLTTFLEKLGLSYAIPRTKRPSRPENAEEILDERVADAFDEVLMSRTTNAMETTRKAGSSTKRSVRTVELYLDFSTHRIRNRGTTHSDSTPSTTLTSPDRW